MNFAENELRNYAENELKSKQADLITKMMWENAVNTGLLDEWAKLQNVQNRVENVQNHVENVQNRVENVQICWEYGPKLSVSASSWLQVEYSTV